LCIRELFRIPELVLLTLVIDTLSSSTTALSAALSIFLEWRFAL